jgi:hypothetical protein
MTSTTATTTDDPGTEAALAPERADLLETLAKHRWFLRQTLDGLDDQQAASTPTASELSLGGLVKHVAITEARWADFALRGPQALAMDESSYAEHALGFRMVDGDTVAGLLARYDEVAARTDELARTADLDASWPLPEAPWFEPGARWTLRRVLLHVVAETSQHAGHADILRESIDGRKSMG